MRSSRLWLVLLVAAIAAALAWSFGLLPQPGAGPRRDAGSAPVALESTPADGASDASKLAATGGRVPDAPVVPARPPIPEGAPRLAGVVVDRQGKGVGGARVVSIPDTTAKTYLPREIGGEGFPGFDAIADGEGRFVVALSKASTNHLLVATAEGFSSTVKRDVGVGSEVRILLERAGRLVGTVMNVDAEPVAGAKVRVLAMLDVLRIEQEAVTDATGAYRIEGWVAAKPAATWWQPTYALVEAAGYAPLFLDRIPAAEPGAEARRDFVVVRGATVSGRVVEADTDKPVGGVPVVLWSEEGRMNMSRGMGRGGSYPMPWGPRRLAQVETAPDGTFRFEHVPSNGFHPIASHTGGRTGILLGYVGAWAPGHAAAREEVPALADGGALEVTLRLAAAGAVAGRVVDAAGMPVANVAVYPRLAPGVTLAWIPREIVADAPPGWAEPTGADGRYRLPWMPLPTGGAADQHLEARRRRDGDGMGGRSEPDGSLTVRLLPGAVVDAPDLVLTEAKPPGDGDVVGIPIRVEDDRGAPVVGATVGWAAANGGQFQRTDAEGRTRFHVMRLRPGQTVPPLQLVARARGFAATLFSVPWTQATPEPVLVRLARGHRLAGTVRQADGSPAAGSVVRVANGAVPPEEAFPEGTPDFMLGQSAPKPGGPVLVHYAAAAADDDGRFVLEDLPEGPYTVVATGARRGAGGSPFDAKPLRDVRPGVPTDAAELDLRLPLDDTPLPGSIEGTVVDAVTKRPVLRLTVRSEGARATQRTIGSSTFFSQGGLTGEVVSPGRYAVASVAPGTYSLLVDAEGYRRARLPGVEVRAGERTVVPPVALERGIVLSGRVAVPTGVDPSTLVLSIVSLDDDSLTLSAPLDSKGRFARAGLSAGRWLLRVMPSSVVPTENVSWALEDGGFLTIAEGAASASRDLTLVPGARMFVELADERLPPSRVMGGDATPAQAAFGAATSLRITAPDGTVLVERKDVTRGWGPWSWHAVKPGRYVVRVTYPAGEVLEQPIDAEVGKDARLPAPGK